MARPARRDSMDEPPAYETLFDTRATLPNYASVAPSSSSREQSPSYTTAEPARRCSDTSASAVSDSDSSSSWSSSAPTTKNKKTSTGGGFLSKWRADLAEDRARRAARVVHVSASEADRITGLDQRRLGLGEREQQQRWRVYYDACSSETSTSTAAARTLMEIEQQKMRRREQELQKERAWQQKAQQSNAAYEARKRSLQQKLLDM